MKKSHFTEEQIAHVLRHATRRVPRAGVPVAELIRKTGPAIERPPLEEKVWWLTHNT